MFLKNIKQLYWGVKENNVNYLIHVRVEIIFNIQFDDIYQLFILINYLH